MQNIFNWILDKILKCERTIYCRTNCKIELPLHKHYYSYRKRRYNTYLKLNYPEFFNEL